MCLGKGGKGGRLVVKGTSQTVRTGKRFSHAQVKVTVGKGIVSVFRGAGGGGRGAVVAKGGERFYVVY